MLLPLLLALAIVAISLAAGRIVLHLLGMRRPTWLAGPVGLAALTVVAAFAIRLPGRAATAAALIALALVVGLVAIRGSPVPSREAGGPEVAAPHLAGLAAIAVVLAAATIPFLLAGRDGILGEGVYTNDHAAQLYWTDWLQSGFGPEPGAVAWGYPVGPQSLVAALAEGTGASLVDAFNGLLLAIPALTALAAIAMLGHLRPVPRVATAALAGLPFLGASFLAQSAFKETVMALLVLAFAATLALAAEPEDGRQPPLPRRAAVGVGALLALTAVLAYSVPGLVWFALTPAAWLLLLLLAGDRRIDWAALGSQLRRRRLPIIAAAAVAIAVAALTMGTIVDFVGRIGDVQESRGRLSSPIWPGEALGIWPEGDFRVVRGEVGGAYLATAIGALAVVAGALVLLRRRAYALLAALAAGAVVYVGARAFASIYVDAKALAVMAPAVVVVALGGLFAAAGGRWSAALRALGAVVVLAAGASTFLALRAAPVGFADRGEELEQLAERIDGEPVAFLGVDRFGAYWLRGTLIRSPGGYVPPEVRPRPEKVWQQGRPMDLDTLPGRRLDEFEYAITTTAAYQSTPPPNMEEVARTDSYALWKRRRGTPRLQVLKEGGAPGVILEPGDDPRASLACRRGRSAPGRQAATVLPTPVVGGPKGWSLRPPFEAPATAGHELELGPGRWQLSLQYHSQVDLTVEAAGLRSELPASLVGMYLTHQGQSSFWPVGEIEVPEGGPVEVSVSAAEPGDLERLVGAERQVWLGRLVATRVDPLVEDPEEVPLGLACGRFVDHIYLRGDAAEEPGRGR
jgi:hypothetical protein